MKRATRFRRPKKRILQRGSVANMTEDTEVLVDQGRAIDPYKAFKFQTDITVADIRGGERLTRDESRPARVLLMGPAGQLFVQDEVSDAEVVEAHRATFAKEAAGRCRWLHGRRRRMAVAADGPGGMGGRGGGRAVTLATRALAMPLRACCGCHLAAIASRSQCIL